MKQAIICDLDGTLCLYDRSTGKHYDRDYENDTLNIAVADVLRRYEDDGIEIVLVSGRKNKYESITIDWLNKKAIRFHALHMIRGDRDHRKDFVVKREVYDKFIKDKYDVLFVLDDRNQVVDLWRELGLTCFQVAPGDF